VTPATREITVATSQPGGHQQVMAAATGVPGLVVHTAVGTGWSLTHEPSGRCAAWWPHGTPEQARACAAALGELADWTTTDLPQLAARRASVCYAILKHGGWVPTRDPARWLAQDGSEVVVVLIDGRQGS
jgi:hypothetical protein